MAIPLPGLQGFRGSDWDNAGKTLYAVKYDYDEGYDRIWKSTDRGQTFDLCNITFDGQAPSSTFPVTAPSAYFNYAIPLMIPTKLSLDETDKMLIAPIGSQTLYLCSDISQDTLAFISVHKDDDNPGAGGVFNGFAECRTEGELYLYFGWYAIGVDGVDIDNKAFLYNAIGDYKKWQRIGAWEARHIHTVRVNPYNNYLYVVLGEPNAASPNVADAGKIMRRDLNNWRTTGWVCVTDTWKTHACQVPNGPDLGLYFSTLEFIPYSNWVVLGEDTDWCKGRIFSFYDDGRDGSNPSKQLPFDPIYRYTAPNLGEFWLGAVRMGDKLYFASMFLIFSAEPESTQCVSTKDGITWMLEESCNKPPARLGDNCTHGVFTYHPERGRMLIFSLSYKDSWYIEMCH